MSKLPIKKQAVEAEAVMYLGPSIKDGFLQNKVMYVGGILPEYLRGFVESDKDVKSLFVSASKIAITQKKLRDKTSIEYARFVRILETYKGA